MIKAIINIYNTSYLKWLFLILLVFSVLVYFYYMYQFYTDKDKSRRTNRLGQHEYKIKAGNALILMFITGIIAITCGYIIESKNTTVRYEFITEDDQKHTGPRCYLSGDLFSTDGTYCIDDSGITYTKIVAYNKIVEVTEDED